MGWPMKPVSFTGALGFSSLTYLTSYAPFYISGFCSLSLRTFLEHDIAPTIMITPWIIDQTQPIRINDIKSSLIPIHIIFMKVGAFSIHPPIMVPTPGSMILHRPQKNNDARCIRGTGTIEHLGWSISISGVP